MTPERNLIGVAMAAGGGYLVSWFAETPTGATMVVVAAVIAAPGLVLRALHR